MFGIADIGLMLFAFPDSLEGGNEIWTEICKVETTWNLTLPRGKASVLRCK